MNNNCDNHFYNLALKYYNRDITSCCVEYIKQTFPNGDMDDILSAIDCALLDIEKNNKGDH